MSLDESRENPVFAVFAIFDRFRRPFDPQVVCSVFLQLQSN
jgi:hypothetical protein